MCGRFTIYAKWEAIYGLLREFLESGNHGWKAPIDGPNSRYNLAPTQDAPIIIRDGENDLEGVMARWDFVPFFFKQPLEEKKWTSINAKVEEITTKPAFRTAIKSKRCLIPNNGFYEWRKDTPDGKKKTPFWIKATDTEVSFFGGIWDNWEGTYKGQPIAFRSCSILTCEPNSLMATIHNRMPVIIRPEDYETWMFGDKDAALKIANYPYPAQMMKATQIGPDVGKVKNDYPELLSTVLTVEG